MPTTPVSPSLLPPAAFSLPLTPSPGVGPPSMPVLPTVSVGPPFADKGMEFRCVSGFKRYANSTGAVGMVASLSVPRAATQRYIWIAFDSPNGKTAAPWYMGGRLLFWLNGQKITEMPMARGNIVVGASQTGINVFSGSTGSGPQPGLRATIYDTLAQDYKSTDLPCFGFNVECDLITMEMDSLSVGLPYLYLSDFGLRTIGDYTGTQDDINNWWRIKATVNGNNRYLGPSQSMWKYNTDLSAASPRLVEDLNTKHTLQLAAGINDLMNVTGANPTFTWENQGHFQAGTVAPTFYYALDGQTTLLAGLIVVSQYPGGL